MSEWLETTLGACFDLVKKKAPPSSLDASTPYVGLEHLTPDSPRVTGAASTASVTSQVGLFESDDVLFGRLRAYLRKVAIADFAGAASTEILVLRARRDKAEPRFLHLLASSSSCIDHAVARSAGSRMPRTSARDLAAFPVRLPPLAEQRRIVDVMASVDAQIESLEADHRQTQVVLNRALANHFEVVTGRGRVIADLCSKVIGGIWGSPEGESEVNVLALGPRIYSPGTTDFVTDGSPLRSFSAKQVEARLVQVNDIILERSGGSPEQPVGRVVIAGEGLEPCIPTDFQRLMRPDPDQIHPRYLFWRLQHDWNAGLTRHFSRRTTGITNLSVKDYIAREVPVPEPEEQVALVDLADGMDAVRCSIANELARLRMFRSVLLTSLLNQDIEIPESYDELLEAVS